VRTDFREWLEQQGHREKTIANHMAWTGRVEKYHGDLDEHYVQDHMASLIDALTYSTDDARHLRPNPSQIPFQGDIRKNVASYRSAVQAYRRFRDSGDVRDHSLATKTGMPSQVDRRQKLVAPTIESVRSGGPR
jgi:hypothetical protein